MTSYLTIAEAAEFIGMSADFVRAEIERGNLARCKFGRLIRIPRTALDRYVSKRTSLTK